MQQSFQSWNTNFLVYLDNLSGYFVLAILIAIIVIVFTYWLVPTDKILFQEYAAESQSSVTQEATSNVRLGNHKTIVDQLKSHLTEEDLAEEKKIESQQLEEIFKLMKNQEDKFHIESKQDIQDQLKLYGL
uniref:Matrix-remodeling-associated protein 7 helical domain-containing protein n=1 Tax=Cacopsylla melanoneura TaxID=428564 RepID=A0A8D9B977_9HEMI